QVSTGFENPENLPDSRVFRFGIAPARLFNIRGRSASFFALWKTFRNFHILPMGLFAPAGGREFLKFYKILFPSGFIGLTPRPFSGIIPLQGAEALYDQCRPNTRFFPYRKRKLQCNEV